MSAHLIRKTVVKGSRSPDKVLAVVSTMIAVLVIFTSVPQKAMAAAFEIRNMDAEMLVGGEISEEYFAVLEDMASISPEAIIDLNDVDVDLSDYDILINVPIQLENIRDIVDRFNVICSVGKSGDGQADFEFFMVFSSGRDLVDGAYEGTVRFPLQFPPIGFGNEGENSFINGDPPDHMYASDIDRYRCSLYLHDQLNDWWVPATTHPDAPLHSQSSTPDSSLFFLGNINW